MPDPRQKLFKIINQFQDSETALEINELLLELERTDPRRFYIGPGTVRVEFEV